MAQYKDTTQPAGAPVLTIDAVTYKCNNFSTTDADTVVNTTDENGNHSGAVSFEGPVTGTAQLQLATAATALPTTATKDADAGTFIIGTGPSAKKYFITQVGVAKPSNGVWTVDISFQQEKNYVGA